jgi:DNA transformation protein
LEADLMAERGKPQDVGGSDSLEGLRNLGPLSAARLRSVGIQSPEELRELGAVRAYLKLKRAYPYETTVIALYALEGAITDTRWYALPDETKARLRKQVVLWRG